MQNPSQTISKRASGRAIRLVAIGLLAMLLGTGGAFAQLKAYTANQDDNTLSVIDVATNTVVDTIPVPGSPRLLVINAAGNRAYITMFGGLVAVVDLDTSAVIATVPAGLGPLFLTLSGDEAFLYVADTSLSVGDVKVIDTATNTVVASLAIGTGPVGIATTPDGAAVYASNNAGNISVIDTATNTITSTFSTGPSVRPFAMAFTPDGAFVYLSDGLNSKCTVVDTATQTVVATIPTASRSFDNVITPNGITVYHPNVVGNSVSVIDTANNTVVATVPVGTAARGVAVTPDGTFVYVTNVVDSTVSVIDTATNTVVATIPVGPSPFGIAIGGTQAAQVPPVLTSDAASVTVNEGQTAANSGTVTDADGDPVSLTASVGSVVNNGDGTWDWSFSTSDGPTQSQTVTITGDDGQGGTSTTSFSLVVNNVAPTIVSVSNNGPIIVGGSATITVSATDPAGANDPLSYAFDCDNNGIFEIGPQASNSASCTFASAGSRTVNVRVTDGDGGAATGSTVVTVLLPPPSCANATASPNLIWPPNHKFVAVGISGIVNPAPGAVTINVTSIFQDEPVQSSGSGNTSPDATGVGTGNPSVRSERDGGNDGRVYHIAFTATGASGSCTGTVKVGVPKSQGNNGGPVDQGPLYNSTLP